MSTLKSTIQSILDEDRRIHDKDLNAQPHFIPLGIEVLSRTLSHNLKKGKVLNLSTFREEVIKKITAKTKGVIRYIDNVFYDQKSSSLITIENVTRYTPGIVYSGNEVMGILYSSKDSYNSAYRSLFNVILNKELKKYLKNTKSDFQVGHTLLGEGSESLAATSATNRLDKVLIEIDNAIESDTLSDEQIAYAIAVSSEASEQIRSLEIHSEYGRSVEINLTKEFRSALLDLKANVVLIQDGKENASWGSTEGKILEAVRSYLPDMHFSPSIKEQAVNILTSALSGSIVKDTLSKLSLSAKVKSAKSVFIAVDTTPIPNLPRVRDAQGKFYSLVSLRSLINDSLQHVISANMGNESYPGGQRRILNYRTGRFAASATVERMSISREGMITAYYNYMKYPYQTFEPGFKQGSPSTRDPKLLISKSIREIAATKVNNRMRSVLV